MVEFWRRLCRISCKHKKHYYGWKTRFSSRRTIELVSRRQHLYQYGSLRNLASLLDAQVSKRESSLDNILSNQLSSKSTICVSTHAHPRVTLFLYNLPSSDPWVFVEKSRSFRSALAGRSLFSPSTIKIHNVTLWFELLYDGSNGGFERFSFLEILS